MRRIVMTVALAGVFACWAVPAGAQSNGVVIQNNGVDSSQSAAGADNVNVSLAPGNSSSTNGAGLNNEVGTVVNEKKDRNRKDRKDRKNTEELAAPVEESAPAPAEGELQAYGEGNEVAPAPEPVAAEQADSANAPVQLPSTGAGSSSFSSLVALGVVLAAAGMGVVSLRQRLFGR